MLVSGQNLKCAGQDGVTGQDAGALAKGACRLEHATSAVLAEALASYLGQPDVCPHGNPIPDSSGAVATQEGGQLGSLPPGRAARIVSIQPTETEVFAYLQERSLMPGQIVRVLSVAPLDGPLTLDVNGDEVVVGRKLVEKMETGLGKRVAVMSQDQNNEIADRGFRIVGIFDSKMAQYEEGYVFAGEGTIQELLGHKDVRTTEIYTHVMNRPGLAVVSPCDRLPLIPRS